MGNVIGGSSYIHVMAALRAIRTTDPRFLWLAQQFGEEPDRHISLATMIDEQFDHSPGDIRQRDALLQHLGDMILEMERLTPVQELFDFTAPLVQDERELLVMLQRLGWRNEAWYTEHEATLALGTSIQQLRYSRARVLRSMRRGAVWTPALRKAAAVVQEMAPISQSAFRAACNLDQEGPNTMTLYGFVAALDVFGIDTWFHLEDTRHEPTIHCEYRIDVGVARETVRDLVAAAEIRIAQEHARQHRLRVRDRRDRQRYLDPWEIPVHRRSRKDDVGFRDAEKLCWWEIPRDDELWTHPEVGAICHAAPLVVSRPDGAFIDHATRLAVSEPAEESALNSEG